MKGYKAFEKGMICRGKQYTENTIFVEKKAEICRSGMHFCKNPLDVFDYYPLIDDNGNMTEFAEVEALDDCKTDDNKKYCTKKLKISVKIDLPAFIKASFEFIWKKAFYILSGDNSQLAASGDYSQLAASGYNSQLAASGYNSQLAASGDNSQLAASGDNSKLTASGDYSQLAASGYDSIIVGVGIDNMAKAKKGSWITLAEWKFNENEKTIIPVCVKTEIVDGEKIKADTFYKLENGKFVECEK